MSREQWGHGYHTGRRDSSILGFVALAVVFLLGGFVVWAYKALFGEKKTR